jgi:signal transduction histidine kinase
MVIERILQGLPFLSPLSAEQVEELAGVGRTVSLPAGHVVCHEGERSDSMYVILTGTVSVYRHDANGKRVDMRQFHEGDYFGELALLDSKPRTATVSCETDCTLFVLDQATFRGVVTANPTLVFGVLAAVADRAREQLEHGYQAELAKLTLESRAEIDRARSVALMVAGVAHELNTPLGITNTAVDMLANRLARPDVVALFNSGEETRQLLEQIQEATTLARRNIARADQLIRDFKKLSVNQMADRPQREDLAQIVASTVELFSINARRSGLTVEIDNRLPPSGCVWFGYPGHLTQVLLNLLGNIERYACEPGAGGRAVIALSAAGVPPSPTFVVTVRDDGPGIAPADLDLVFEPFFTTGRSKGGTGLGLSIVRNIVTSVLNGKITLASTPGKGTTVQLTLPQEVPDVQHQLAHSDR